MHLKIHSKHDKPSTENNKVELKDEKAVVDDLTKFNANPLASNQGTQMHPQQEMAANTLPFPLHFLPLYYSNTSKCAWFNPDVFSQTQKPS